MLDLTGYKLTFDDEFNTRSISQDGTGTRWADIRSQWRFDANSDIGFGHSSFVDPGSGYDPFNVAGGVLSITAVPDRTASGYPGSWESGLITTQGNFSQTYGYFEMRADLADAKGGWDAFWLLPDRPAANPNALPGWQELDVIEHYGAYNQGSYRWIHTTDPGPNQNPNADLQVFSNDPAQVSGYHTYGMDWQADKISFYFDGRFIGSRPTPSDMHGPMYLLANLATQGDADDAGVPITMKIDYIRAYSKAPDAVAIKQDAVSAPDGQDPGLSGATAASQAMPQMAHLFGDIIHDVNTAGGKIYALYDAILDREPDILGFEHTVYVLEHGMSLSAIANALINSDEGQSHLAAGSNQEFVARLYQTALHRNGEAAGINGWVDALNHGTSRGDVAIAFALSAENVAGFQSKLDAGIFVPDQNAADVARLYYGILGRAPEANGLDGWTKSLEAGASLKSTIDAFLASQEFTDAHRGQTDAQFVDSLYQSALGRHAEASGLDGWVGALSHGTSRSDVALAIAESNEAQVHLAPLIEHGWLVA